ncbi:MAG: ABC transporter permease subunit [Gemmatimonadales bacterium]
MSGAPVLASQVRNVLRSRWIAAYAVMLFLAAALLIRFGGGGERALLSLVNVVLALVPLVSVVFGTLYVYHAREFIELLLTQPIGRGGLYLALFGGLALPLSAAFLLGVGAPLAVAAMQEPGIVRQLSTLLAVGVLLTLVFTGLALLVAVTIEDRAKGLGAALLVWLACTALYDGVILLVITAFRDYPLELPTLILTALNPVDLARVTLLLTFDVAALMGYTGAVFERAFGGGFGLALAVALLLVSAAIPFAAGLYWFRRRDL